MSAATAPAAPAAADLAITGEAGPSANAPALEPRTPGRARQPGGWSTPIAYLMVAPYVVHFAVFMAYPLAFAVVLAFHKWNIITPMKWVGLANINRLLHDELFFRAIKNTFVFLALHIPTQIIAALLLALLLNQAIRARTFLRAAYFTPVIVSGVATTILWQQMFNNDTGLLNAALSWAGLPRVQWLTDARLAMPAIAFMATWKNVGLYIILFLVGLQSIPRYLYEAAAIDGATPLQAFRFITLPSLRNTVTLVFVLSTINGFSLFIEPYVMTGGGPMDRTLSAMLYIYNQGMTFGHMGYASCLGLFFAIIMLVTVYACRKVGEVKD